MLNPRLASRYAKSLIDIAAEQNSLEETLKDMQLLDAISKQNKDFVLMMRSPVIKADKKNAIIDAVLHGKIGVLTQQFIKLLISKGREQNLDEIAQAYIQQYRESKKIRMVRLTTAAPVDSSVIDTLKSKLKAAYTGDSVEFETKVDPALLGGFVLDMGDRQLDASILRDLNDIKKQFTKNLYVPQF
ncbi:MAG TPA: ATP synthase F1 subunit delta [Chitinophagaceae bacterium]|nr:ATP synthase F1 subunit delta [Chitinophagaceae bacterium]